jgi:hypothetical protein
VSVFPDPEPFPSVSVGLHAYDKAVIGTCLGISAFIFNFGCYFNAKAFFAAYFAAFFAFLASLLAALLAALFSAFFLFIYLCERL